MKHRRNKPDPIACGIQARAILPDPPLALHQMPGHLIRRLQQVAVSLFVEAASAAGFDLTPVQYAALVGIATHPNIDQATLAALIAYDRATIGGVVDRLQRKGLVRRTSSPRDKRVRQLVVEPPGNRLLGHAAVHVEAVQRRILEPLSPEEAAIFMMLIAKLVSAHNQHCRAPTKTVRRPPRNGETGGPKPFGTSRT